MGGMGFCQCLFLNLMDYLTLFDVEIIGALLLVLLQQMVLRNEV
jgi:hypothetical protein